MLSKELIGLMEKKEFVSVATCDFKGRPNAVPKFVLKVEHFLRQSVNIHLVMLLRRVVLAYLVILAINAAHIAVTKENRPRTPIP